MSIPHEVAYFADRAKEFVTWCQASHAGKDPKTFQLEALPMLSILYATAWMLPQDETHTSLPEVPPVTPEHLQQFTENFKAMPFQLYWEILMPSRMEGEPLPVCSDLLENFQDIYTDLMSGLWHFEQGMVEAAVFTWRFRFSSHWGNRLVSALHALHLFEPKSEAVVGEQ